MQARINPLMLLVALLLLAGIAWLLVTMPSGAGIVGYPIPIGTAVRLPTATRPAPPPPDPLITYTFVPLVSK